MKTVQILRANLLPMLFDLKGSTIIAAKYNGGVDMLKTGNPYVGATQQYKFTAGLNWVYEDAVNRRLFKRYGPYHVVPFVAGPRSWGTHLMDGSRETCVVTHKDKYYMNVTLGTVGRRTFRFGGRIIPGSVLLPFIKVKPVFVKSQGLNYAESVKKKDFAFDNLIWVQIKGVRYNLI